MTEKKRRRRRRKSIDISLNQICGLSLSKRIQEE